jgi:hypothetical protein
MGLGGQRHAPATLAPRNTRWGCMGPVTVWTGAKNLTPKSDSILDRQARSESPYRLSYRGPLKNYRGTRETGNKC